MALNINSATANELKLLNGIQEKRAKIILEMREKNENGLEADDLLAIPDLSTVIRNLLRENKIIFLPFYVDREAIPRLGLPQDKIGENGPNNEQVYQAVPPLGLPQDVLELEATGLEPQQLHVNAPDSLTVDEGLANVIERLKAVLKSRKESDIRLNNLESKLLPHGVDVLKNLDNRIETLEANDSTAAGAVSKSLSHIEERLIILEQKSKLEPLILNEKLNQRLVNLETNYQNSVGPEILHNLFERLEVVENRPAQVSSDILTKATKRLTELENKSAELFVQNKLRFYENSDSVQGDLQSVPNAPNPTPPNLQNVAHMWQGKSAPQQTEKKLIGDQKDRHGNHSEFFEDNHDPQICGDCYVESHKQMEEPKDRHGDHSEIFEDNHDPRGHGDRYVESRRPAYKSSRWRRDRSPYKPDHRDHHQFEDDYDPRRDVGHKLDRSPFMYDDKYDPHDASVSRRPPPYNGRHLTAHNDAVENYPCGRGPPSPKMPTFNGNSKDDWVAYHVQFERIAKTYRWDVETKLEKLIESLRGKAASYFGRLPELDRENYAILTTVLLDRYGRKDPPSTLRLQLQFIKQTVEEDLEAFAERVQQLAHDAYPQATVQTVKDAAIDAFLRGCKEKAASLAAMNRTPDSLSEAISVVKRSFHNQKAVYGESSKGIQ